MFHFIYATAKQFDKISIWQLYTSHSQKGGELPMKDIFVNLVAPIVVGIALALFDDWLDSRHNKK